MCFLTSKLGCIFHCCDSPNVHEDFAGQRSLPWCAWVLHRWSTLYGGCSICLHSPQRVLSFLTRGSRIGRRIGTCTTRVDLAFSGDSLTALRSLATGHDHSFSKVFRYVTPVAFHSLPSHLHILGWTPPVSIRIYMRCWAPFWYVFVYVEMQVFVWYVRQWIKFMYGRRGRLCT